MKKRNYLAYLAVFFVAAAITLLSCKKEKETEMSATGTGYYIRFKADGVQKEYKDSSFARPEMADVPSCHTGYFSAWKAGSGGKNKNKFSFRVYGADTVSAGAIYTEAVFAPVGVPAACGFWFDENGTLYENMNSVVVGISAEIQPFQTKITELMPTTVKGTFSGKLKNYKTANIFAITEGEFYLLRN